jgi:hypothetical protein
VKRIVKLTVIAGTTFLLLAVASGAGEYGIQGGNYKLPNGISIPSTAPGDGQILQYSASANAFVYVTPTAVTNGLQVSGAYVTSAVTNGLQVSGAYVTASVTNGLQVSGAYVTASITNGLDTIASVAAITNGAYTGSHTITNGATAIVTNGIVQNLQ